MRNLIFYKRLWLLVFLGSLAGISTLPAEHRVSNRTLTINQTKNLLLNHKRKSIINHSADMANGKTFNHTTDLKSAATNYQQRVHLPVTVKPRGFLLPKNRPPDRKSSQQPHQTAAQNYYNNYFTNFPSIDHGQPFNSLADDPVIAKFLAQQNKQFEARPPTIPQNYDESLLGSGDFGILRGGTFYSDEQQSQFIHDQGSDVYYGAASNTQGISSTEGFIQKYTYPEEQFAEFRDFADLGTPADSQYVVVYAANNGSLHDRQYTRPKNIFEQLQEIDKEKALEQKQLRKNQTNSSITKLKLVKTKQVEKKWVQKQTEKIVEEDPLIALS